MTNDDSVSQLPTQTGQGFQRPTGEFGDPNVHQKNLGWMAISSVFFFKEVRKIKGKFHPTNPKKTISMAAKGNVEDVFFFWLRDSGGEFRDDLKGLKGLHEQQACGGIASTTLK